MGASRPRLSRAAAIGASAYAGPNALGRAGQAGKVDDVTDGALPVYLVHWNAPEWCQSACESVLASVGVELDLTVIDNSPDGGGALAAALGPERRILATGQNLGFAGGANVGLQEWLAGSSEFCIVGSHDLHVETD